MNDLEIDVSVATDSDLQTIKNLVPYYVYEMSGPMGWSSKADGTFGGCDDIAEYWECQNPLTDPEDRWPNKDWEGHPFLVKVDDRIGGFAMIRWRPEAETFDVGEYFILRRYQGLGIGKSVAHELFDRFRGKWEVWQMDRNAPAQAFWRRVVSSYTDGRFDESIEKHWLGPDEGVVQRFRND